EAPFSRNQIVQYLEDNGIATRLLFGGNIVRQPAYQDIERRIIGELKNSDFVMNQVFWIGVYPGLTKLMLDYIIQTINDFIKKGGRRDG
ncbi:DegT/DnrJ/EryC1/StrS family aminotransferase, partial [Chloroflexota bacterium]